MFSNAQGGFNIVGSSNKLKSNSAAATRPAKLSREQHGPDRTANEPPAISAQLPHAADRQGNTVETQAAQTLSGLDGEA
jgi:hypothetical protein